MFVSPGREHEEMIQDIPVTNLKGLVSRSLSDMVAMDGFSA